jgi:hypothetical protein
MCVCMCVCVFMCICVCEYVNIHTCIPNRRNELACIHKCYFMTIKSLTSAVQTSTNCLRNKHNGYWGGRVERRHVNGATKYSHATPLSKRLKFDVNRVYNKVRLLTGKALTDHRTITKLSSGRTVSVVCPTCKASRKWPGFKCGSQT